MSANELERIGFELEQIRLILERAIPPPSIPMPLERKLGRESITYIDEDEFLEHENEEIRQTARGIIPNVETDSRF